MGCWTVMGGPCVQRAPQECCLPGPAPRGHRCHSAHTCPAPEAGAALAGAESGPEEAGHSTRGRAGLSRTGGGGHTRTPTPAPQDSR